jgi:2-polyprenyl-3-methyl-5-hydroxy-6-metoxy-1,4-benzoquinol methylase
VSVTENDPTQASRYVDGRYEETNPDWHDEDAPWKSKRIADFLEDQGIAPSSVCDLGCGAGGVLAGLAERLPAATLVGYDISPQAVELARRLHPGVEVRPGEPDYGTAEPFDLVMLVDVFEHVEDYLGFLRRVAPLGKRLLCHVPLDMSAQMVARGEPILRVREQVGHLHYFSKDTALATLRDAGYRIEATRYLGETIDTPNRTWRMKLASWPRRICFRLAPDLTVRLLGGYSLLVLCEPVS